MKNLVYLFLLISISACIASCKDQAKPERFLITTKEIPIPADWEAKFKDASKREISDTIGDSNAYVEVKATILTEGDSNFITRVSVYGIRTGSTEIKVWFHGMPLNSGDEDKISMFLGGDVSFYRDRILSKKLIGRSFVINSNGSIEKEP